MNRDSAVKKIKNKPFRTLCEGIVADMKRLGVPGISIAIWHGDEQWSTGLGVTSVDHPLPVTGETLFQIGSISKTMTATVLMQLVDAGVLDLDVPVQTYIPSLRLADMSVAERVTTRHLLTHTGGWMGDYFNHYGYGNDALDKMVKSLVRLPQISPLGTVMSYNNAGFAIASRLIEVLTKQPYEEAVTSRLFGPLGMPESFFYPNDAIMTRRFAVGHVTWNDVATIANPWAIGRAANGVGGVVCSAETLLTYARFHSDDGAGILSASSKSQMRTKQVSAGGRGDMGISWFVRDHGPFVSYGHGGATKGQKALFRFIPAERFGFAMLTNSDRGSIVHDAAWSSALELYFGHTPAAPTIQSRSVAELAPYCGAYDYALSLFAVEASDGGIVIHETPKGGFPMPSTPAGPPVPDIRAQFIGPDTFVCLDEPRKGEVGDFIRATDGSIAYLRIGGRANPRIKGGADQ
jgi:CubicO group peptidase (beta-lactamase class C family)